MEKILCISDMFSLLFTYLDSVKDRFNLSMINIISRKIYDSTHLDVDYLYNIFEYNITQFHTETIVKYTTTSETCFEKMLDFIVYFTRGESERVIYFDNVDLVNILDKKMFKSKCILHSNSFHVVNISENKSFVLLYNDVDFTYNIIYIPYRRKIMMLEYTFYKKGLLDCPKDMYLRHIRFQYVISEVEDKIIFFKRLLFIGIAILK